MRFRNRRYPAQTLRDTDATPVTLSEEEALPILQTGEVIGGHRMPWGSNYTFLVGIDAGPGKYLRAIYKPRDGERPLYDFPQGTLYKREYAAYALSRDLGWPDVPLTIIRDGPYGVGSMQLYVECDPEITYFEILKEKAEHLQKFAIFDLVVNNADRKAGHCLLDEDGRVWSIDHGLTFHSVFKLRTVMLEFWNKEIPQPCVANLESLLKRLQSATDSITDRLCEMTSPREIKALINRLEIVIENPVLPMLDPYRNVPWPWV